MLKLLHKKIAPDNGSYFNIIFCFAESFCRIDRNSNKIKLTNLL
nr:MAG TPA: hypothetical protein [Caudoviricetes sp.]